MEESKYMVEAHEEQGTGVLVEEENLSAIPLTRNHKYFKAQLHRAGFTKLDSIKAYSVLTESIRDSIALGFAVNLNPVCDFVPYNRRTQNGITISIRSNLHQAVQRPKAIKYSKIGEDEIMSDPDWE